VYYHDCPYLCPNGTESGNISEFTQICRIYQGIANDTWERMKGAADVNIPKCNSFLQANEDR
jgi:hypothetical protein